MYIADVYWQVISQLRAGKTAGFAQTDAMIRNQTIFSRQWRRYGLCVWLESRGEENATVLRKKLLARDGFWFCFSFLAAFNDAV